MLSYWLLRVSRRRAHAVGSPVGGGYRTIGVPANARDSETVRAGGLARGVAARAAVRVSR